MALNINCMLHAPPRPWASTSSKPDTFNLRNLSLCLIVTLLITLALPTSCSKEISPWPHLQLEGQVENLIIDERDGSIFIVANGDIFKYDKQLELSSRTELSQTTTTKNVTKSQSDRVNKLLLIEKKFNPNLLLTCSQSSDFLFQCLLHKTSELKSVIPVAWSNHSNAIKIKLQPGEQVLAINIPSETSDLLFVTKQTPQPISSDTQNVTSNTSYLPTISRFDIAKSSLTKLFFQQKSVLQYQNRKHGLTHQYVYLFSYNHHTHFILNDIPYEDNSYNKKANHFVKLARICNNDTDLTSYTEISLPCDYPNRQSMQAKAAYLDTHHEDQLLFVVFESISDIPLSSSSTSKRHHAQRESFLCSYSMKLIDDIFNRVISDCHQGHQTSNLLSKFNSDPSPTPCQRDPPGSNDWCMSKTNPYIDGTSHIYDFKEDSLINLNGLYNVNFVHVAKQGQKNHKKVVLFIGTEYGELTKISLDDEPYYTMDLETYQVKTYRTGDKLRSKQFVGDNDRHLGTKFTSHSSIIYAVSNDGHTVSQLNIDSCNYHQTCRACLETLDPLGCVWCGGSCTAKQDCKEREQISHTSCPPMIIDFSPKSGPITGMSRLKIWGDHFGTPAGYLQVRLDDVECKIQAINESNIECITDPVNEPRNVTISISALDENPSPISSNGTTISNKPFSYVQVKVFGLNVKANQKSQDYRIVDIYGQNLNAGSDRTVLIGDTVCEIVELEENKIGCSLNLSSFVTGKAGNLTLLVDEERQLIDLSLYKGNLNIASNFTFVAVSKVEETTMITTLENSNLKDELSWPYYILGIIILISLAVVCIIRSGNFPKIKISRAFESLGEDKSKGINVSFRNPQSQKFAQSDQFNVNTDTMSGLIKFNGSVMSSDHFGKPTSEQFEQDQPLMNNLDDDVMAVLTQEKVLIDRSRLTLGHVLGSGQFGRVYKGFLKDETGNIAPVAVKTLHNRSNWDDAIDNRAFLEEGLMMRDFDHENVLALIGVAFDSNGLPMVITPFMLYGDLRTYISDEANTPTVKELIDFGTQVAQGMAYLSGLKFVHRDLAARNCMLDDNLVVKVADFGLSRDIYERDYYSSDNKKAKLPVKWMAIESLEKGIYSTKTDVWSYGIVLWELMTRGVIPYPDVDNFDLFSYLKEGRRMLRPRYCPLILYKIMLSCWDENPGNRPTFDELVKRVSDVITQLKIAKDGQQKVSRDLTYCDVPK